MPPSRQSRTPGKKRVNAAEAKHDAALAFDNPVRHSRLLAPEQAQAALERLDDLRERIAAHYQLQLFDPYREQQGAGGIDPPDPTEDDQPF